LALGRPRSKEAHEEEEPQHGRVAVVREQRR
jgi:hypothetical protein